MPQGSKETGEYKEKKKKNKFPTRLLPQHSDKPSHPPRGHIPSLESYGQSLSAHGGHHTAPRMPVTIPGRWGCRSTDPPERIFGDSDVQKMLFWYPHLPTSRPPPSGVLSSSPCSTSTPVLLIQLQPQPLLQPHCVCQSHQPFLLTPRVLFCCRGRAPCSF